MVSAQVTRCSAKVAWPLWEHSDPANATSQVLKTTIVPGICINLDCGAWTAWTAWTVTIGKWTIIVKIPCQTGLLDNPSTIMMEMANIVLQMLHIMVRMMHIMLHLPHIMMQMLNIITHTFHILAADMMHQGLIKSTGSHWQATERYARIWTPSQTNQVRSARVWDSATWPIVHTTHDEARLGSKRAKKKLAR